MTVIYVIVIAYLAGSVPFGLIVSRLYGVNITQTGSGNIGATNVFRVLGPFAGMTVLAADIAKGFIAVQLAYFFMGNSDVMPVVTAISAVLGHSFSPFMGMSGGKGVATAAGALIALMPKIALILFIIWIFIIVMTRYVSLASLSIALLLPMLGILTKQNLPNKVLSVVVCLIIFYTHRSNIGRLLKGEEYKFQWKKNE